MASKRRNLGDTIYWTLIGVLALSSAFFTVQVEVRRGDWKTHAAAGRIESGESAVVVGVLDGDEIAVEKDGEITVVRLLGIKTIGSSTNEPGISSFAASSRSRLQNLILNERVSLVYDEYKTDSGDRLLAYVQDGEEDIGRQLVSEGLALSYVKYVFSRQADYSLAESRAKSAGIGLWGHPKAAARADALQVTWRAQSEDAE